VASEKGDAVSRPILEVTGLTRNFGRFTALSDVSLEVPQGGLAALIGPNGAGKTTFYNTVSGRFPPSAGRVFFDGDEITGMPAHRLARRGLLRSFQVTNIFPDLTVIENVLVPLVLHHRKGFAFWGKLKTEKALFAEAEDLLGRVGILSEARRPAHALAYGDKRLVEMAIVLARRPRLVMLDEPTAGMTPGETDRMIGLIKDLADAADTHFFLTEHDMKVVFSVASYIFVLHQGRLLAQGTAEEIRGNAEVKAAYLGGSLDV